MKKTNKPIRKSAEITPEDIKLIKKLNALQKNYATACAKHITAVSNGNDSAAKTMSPMVDQLLNQLFELRQCLKQPVKFNSATGEYFYACGSKPGTEKFIVRITKFCTTDIEVEAESFTEADALAKERAEEESVTWSETYAPSGNIAV